MRFLVLCLLCGWVVTAAAEERDDYDLDDNGLIEINDLADLNEIRNHLDGAALYGDNSGCPDGLCVGFELTQDLNFDSNEDGVIDENDNYWNEGEGWMPLGSADLPFTATFDGKNNAIYNLVINRPEQENIGLFGMLDEATITDLGLTGALMFIVGRYRVGGLAGYAINSTFASTYSTGDVTANSQNYFTIHIGGLIGELKDGTVISSYTTGNVTGLQPISNGSNVTSLQPTSNGSTDPADDFFGAGNYMGGLVGRSEGGIISKSFARGNVTGASYIGGLVGFANGGAITACYATGNVIVSKSRSGGLVGTSTFISLTASYATGNVKILSESLGENGSLMGLSARSTIEASFSIGSVITKDVAGAVFGASIIASNNYWASDNSAQPSTEEGFLGASFLQLQCPTAPDDNECTNITLYNTWGDYVDENGQPYWNFGTSSELPGLNIQPEVYHYLNLAPSVGITFMQNGEVVDIIDAGGGDVLVTAQVEDPNGGAHTFAWSIGEDNPGETDGSASFTFDPTTLDGNYSLSVIVTDDGYPSASAEAIAAYEVEKEVVVNTPAPTTNVGTNTGGSGGGGSSSFIFLLLLAIAGIQNLGLLNKKYSIKRS